MIILVFTFLSKMQLCTMYQLMPLIEFVREILTRNKRVYHLKQQ